jgi:hypothetical protein
MPVLMVCIRVMSVAMPQSYVLMAVAVPFTGGIVCTVRMAVVFIVNMFMGVSNWLMQMFMLMPLCKVQPNTDRHKCASHQELRG